MKNKFAWACVAVLAPVLGGVAALAATMEKVTAVIPQNSVFILNWNGAKDAGVFSKHDIDLTVDPRPFAGYLAGIPSKQAVATTYSGIDAILKMNDGMDLAVIGGGLTVFQEVYVPVNSPIKTIADLRGKKIGTQRIGGSDHLAAEAILQAKGLDLKDVQFVTLGGDEPVRVEMLKKGLVDAVCSVPPGPVRLAREGYNVLGGPKDLKIGNPISAVALTDAQLKTHRDEAKKVLRAILRGLRFMHERREETIQIMSRWLSQTPDVARDSYDSIMPSFSIDGGTVDKTFEFAIESRKATVKTEKPVLVSQVRDFTLLRELQKELRLQ